MVDGNIHNIDTYIKGMSTTLTDKLWWSDLIPDEIDTVIDYGCAQGDLALLMQDKYQYIGIDNSSEMLQLARHNHILHFGRSSEFYPSLIEANGKYDPSKTVLVLNSVMHEIFSYLSDAEIHALFEEMFGNGIRCVAIRDMHLPDTEDLNKIGTRNNKARIEQSYRYSYLWTEYMNYMMYGRYSEGYRQEDKGRIAFERMPLYITEFLMKYRYVENWRREMRENYFWPWLQMISQYIRSDGNEHGFYGIAHESEFRVQFIVDRIKEDFDIDFDLNTHRKVLLLAL